MLRLQRQLNIPHHPVELRMSGVLRNLIHALIKDSAKIEGSSSIDTPVVGSGVSNLFG